MKWSKPISWVCSVLSLIFVIYTLGSSNLSFSSLKVDYNISWISGFGFFLFFGLNHTLDALVWKSILNKEQIQISTKKALMMNWKSLLFSIITPNRIGEIFKRRMLMPHVDPKLTYRLASVHYVFKPITFVLLFLLSWIFLYDYTYGIWCLMFSVCFLVFFRSIYSKLIFLNSLRVLSYCMQHLFLLGLISITINEIGFLHIVHIHSSGALIPHVFGTEIFMKSALFKFLNPHWVNWHLFTLSLTLLWLTNIAIPAFVSLMFKSND
ncbi:MAG: hypothetical protein ACPGSD_05460 [Flavobacteriales bacterium]